MLLFISFRVLYALICAYVAMNPVLALPAFAPPRDSFALPPSRETILSPNRRFEFVITPFNGDWHTMRCTGKLLNLKSSVPGEIWSKTLPNRIRPRFAQVTSTGYTVTFDDWDNVKSANAVVVYDPSGALVRSYSFDQLVETLGIDPQVALDKAKPGLGWWMTTRPRQNRQNEDVEVAIGGRIMTVHAADGSVRIK